MNENRLEHDIGAAALVSNLRIAWILWGALLGSVVLCGVLGGVFRGIASPEGGVGSLTTPLVMTGFFMAMSGGLVFRRIHRDVPSEPAPGQSRVTVDPSRVRRSLGMAILAWALFEGAGVVGLVLALLGGKGWPMIVLGLGLLAIHPPRRALFFGNSGPA